METYTYSSSSSYSVSPNSSTHFPSREERSRKNPPPPAYLSALHSVRKLPAKNVITKKPIAPMPPTPPKIYKVDPINFRDVVHRLTAAPEFRRTRLQEVAPPALSLSPVSKPIDPQKPTFENPGAAAVSPSLGFNLSSPSALAWCSSILLSPGTVSSLETSAVI